LGAAGRRAIRWARLGAGVHRGRDRQAVHIGAGPPAVLRSAAGTLVLMPTPNPRAAIAALADRQGSVVTTAQCLRLGADPRWVSRQVESGRWQRLHRGVLVVHSGPPEWRTKATAALLYAGVGAGLSHAAAAYVHAFSTQPPRVIDVTIPYGRRVDPSPGLRVHTRRRTALEHRSRFIVVSRGDAALDLLGNARSDDDAVGVLCAAVRAGTWPQQIFEALERRPNTRGRRLVVELLGLVAEGIESPMELRYHRDVERKHGLPRATLQKRQVIAKLWIRADGVYEGLGVRTELDGQLGHPWGRTDEDAWRDNAVVIAHGEITLRYRWSHVAGTSCRTAVQVVAALRSRGWPGTPHPCSQGCSVR